MISPRFLIAKYTPDLHRMEPRNFGVIAWGDGVVAARFLGEQDDGTVKVPALIERDSRRAYKEWLTFWRYNLSKDRIVLRNKGTVAKDSSEYLDALMQTSKEHFRLVDGGVLLEKIRPAKLNEFVDEMYSKLVEHEASVPPGMKFSASRIFIRKDLTRVPFS